MSNKEFFITHTHITAAGGNQTNDPWISIPMVVRRSTNQRVVGSIPAQVNKIFQSFYEGVR